MANPEQRPISHPDETRLIAFAKTVLTPEYMKQLAAWVKHNYPGSADRVLPELRKIYKEKWR